MQHSVNLRPPYHRIPIVMVSDLSQDGSCTALITCASKFDIISESGKHEWEATALWSGLLHEEAYVLSTFPVAALGLGRERHEMVGRSP